MFDNSSVFQQLKLPSRCLDAVTSDEDKHRFVVGTYSARADNELHLIEFIEETNEIVTGHVFKHPNEILSVSCCPSKNCWPLLFTCHRGGYMTEHFESGLQSSGVDTTGCRPLGERLTDARAMHSATLWQLVDLDSVLRPDDEEKDATDSGEEKQKPTTEEETADTEAVASAEDLSEHSTAIETDEEKSKITFDVGVFKVADDGSDDLLDTEMLDDALMMERLTALPSPRSCRLPENMSLEPMWTLPCETALIDAESFKYSCFGEGPISTVKVVWNPNCARDRVMSIGTDSLRYWQLLSGFSGANELQCVRHSTQLCEMTDGCFDPHYLNTFVSVNGTDIRVWNVLKMAAGETQVIRRAHKKRIVCVDYNPNKPNHVVTSSEDRTLKVWDLKHAQTALRVVCAHSHSVQSVRFNRFHDQLLVSGGGDCDVHLWNVISVSSAPLGELEDSAQMTEDALVKSYRAEHDDSVCDVQWSAKDAWVFATLSFDGKLIIHHVPASTKYQILL